MLTMDQVKDIKFLSERKGKSLRGIVNETGHAFETVKKYAEMEDFNIKPAPRKERKGKLDPYKDTIRKWLEDDLKAPRKQRHTAQRIYNRLKEVYGDEFNASDRSVRACVAILRKEINLKQEGYLPLEHPPGEAQADFGAAEFVEKGKRYQGHYLTLSFPHSNGGYTQLFKGENQECLLTGLKNIFKHIGLVPSCIWFDNLSTAVKKIKKYGERDKTKGFERFELHYRFDSNFCNPSAGHEKGSVECKVGYHRRNFLVPVPEFEDLEEYNKELLKKADEDMQRKHYVKGALISELFEEDKKAMHKLPEVDFEIFRLEKAKANNYGKVSLDTYIYSISPDYAGKEVWLKATANEVFVLNDEYKLIQSHPRLYGEQRESMKWVPYLDLMAKRPTALKYTGFFKELPETIKSYFNKCEYQEKKAALLVLSKMVKHSSIEMAKEAFEIALTRGVSDLDSIWAIYYKMTAPVIELPELPVGDKIPEVKAYDVDTSAYDSLIKGGQGNAIVN